MEELKDRTVEELEKLQDDPEEIDRLVMESPEVKQVTSVWSFLCLLTLEGRSYDYFQLTDEKPRQAEVQVTCPGTHSCLKQNPNSGLLDSKPHSKGDNNSGSSSNSNWHLYSL